MFNKLSSTQYASKKSIPFRCDLCEQIVFHADVNVKLTVCLSSICFSPRMIN